MTLKLPVTLLVITCNEEAHIARCLDSVPFAAEKIVVDSGSSDATAEIAAAHGARVVGQSWLGFGPQRIFATTLANYDWILFLDADECLSPELALEFERRLPQILNSSLAGAFLRRTAWFMGRPMHWYRPLVGERIERFYHRGRAEWTATRVHEALRLRGPAAQFKAPLFHNYTPTLMHRLVKDACYAELKAQDWAERGRPVRAWECPFIFGSIFMKDYFLRLAFLDGWRGLVVAYMAAMYATYKRLRYYEMSVNPDSIQAAAKFMQRHRLGPP